MVPGIGADAADSWVARLAACVEGTGGKRVSGRGHSATAPATQTHVCMVAYPCVPTRQPQDGDP
jgi:hypothetical protein